MNSYNDADDIDYYEEYEEFEDHGYDGFVEYGHRKELFKNMPTYTDTVSMTIMWTWTSIGI